MANYSIGTATQYDSLPLLPAIGTLNGGIQLNNNISMDVGARVEFDGLKFGELVHPTLPRVLTHGDTSEPYFYSRIEAGESVITGWNNITISSPSFSSNLYKPLNVSCTATAILGRILVNHTKIYFARAISRQFRVKDSTGAVVYKWLDQVSDYKSTPPSASIAGTLQWYKLASDGNEINNYLTTALFLSAVTTPTEPVVVYILDKNTDVSSIPATINGQPVTLDYSFSGDKNKSFDFGFSFNF